jgi:hypothetical protein
LQENGGEWIEIKLECHSSLPKNCATPRNNNLSREQKLSVFFRKKIFTLSVGIKADMGTDTSILLQDG